MTALEIITTVALTLAAYLLGSLPFALWITRWRTGRDVRAGGSGHAGATNAMRQAGWAAGGLVLALDLAKGFAAEWLAARYGPNLAAPVLAAAAAVAGHCWPVWSGFRGGMGLAVAGGVIFAAYPLGFALGLGLAAGLTLLLRHAARACVLGGVLVGPLIWAVSASPPRGLICAAAGLVVAARFSIDWNRVYRELWLDRAR